MGLFDEARNAFIGLEARVAKLEGVVVDDPVPPPVEPEPEPDPDFDVVKAVSDCKAGGTVFVPPGHFVIDRQLTMKSGMTLQGAGVGKTLIESTVKTGYPIILFSVEGARAFDFTAKAPAVSKGPHVLQLRNHKNTTLERLKIIGGLYALKADTAGSNLVMRDIEFADYGQVYVSNVHGLLAERIKATAITAQIDTSSFHALYVAQNNKDHVWRDTAWSGGWGFTFHLYHESGSAGMSERILFDGLTVNGKYAIVVSGGFRAVLRRVKAVGTDPAYGAVTTYDPELVVEDFDIQGGAALHVSRKSGGVVHFRTGTYKGPKLGTGATFENVVRV